MTFPAWFIVIQLVLFSLFPLCCFALNASLRRTFLYTYIGVLFTLGILVGDQWAGALWPSFLVTGTALTQATLMLVAVLFIALERDAVVVKTLIQLVMSISVFLLCWRGFGQVAGTIGEQDAAMVVSAPFGQPSSVIIAMTVQLMLSVLLFFLVVEPLKKRIHSPSVMMVGFTAVYVAVLGPASLITFQADSEQTLAKGVMLGVLHAPMLLALLLIFRARFVQYLLADVPLRNMFGKTRGDLEGIIADQSKQIRKREDQYQSLVEGQFNLICLFSPDSRLRFVNGAFRRFFSHRSQSPVGRRLTDFLPPDDRDGFRTYLGRFSPDNPIQQYEMDTVGSKGQRRCHLWTTQAFFDVKGRVDYFQAVATDITDRKLLEEHFRQAQKMEAVGNLTGGIAHDFNNILGIIVGNLELMKNLPGTSQTLHEHIDAALSSANRGTVITKKLLRFSRNHPGGESLVSVNSVIRELYHLIEKSLTVSIDIRLTLEPDLWQCRVDAGDLEDAILNLTLNARDAMSGSGALLIKTENCSPERCEKTPAAGRSGSFVLLTISDNGQGMSDDVVKKAFDPFFTTKDSGQGSGLGLSMVYGFVHRSGGHIDIQSELGLGTTIRIYLPRADIGQEAPAPVPVPATLKGLHGRETVPVVDDEHSLLRIASSFLRQLGYRVLTASDGRSALRLLERKDGIDVLFTDIVMPGGINGYELARRALKLNPTLRIIVASGYRQKLRHASALDNPELRQALGQVLEKPYTQHQLGKAIRDALSKRTSAVS